MKNYLKEPTNNNERRKSSKFSSGLYLQKNFNPLLNSPIFFNKRNSANINKQPSKEKLKVNKTPIGAINSLKLNPLKASPLKLNSINKKKKPFQTGIFGKSNISLRTMEFNIRKKLIDLSTRIENGGVSSFNDSFALKLELPKKNLNKMSKSLKLEELKNNKFFENDKNKINYASCKSPKIISISKQKLEKTRNSPKNFFYKISSKSLSTKNSEISKMKKNEQNFRKLIKTNILYDSFEDNESENEAENTGLFISPDNKFILFFDILIIISTLIVAIYNPYYISTMKFFCFSNHFLIKYIYFFIDFLFICDLLLGFFRAYYNNKMKLITKISDIINHYLSSYFLIDFIQSFPLFTLIINQCDKNWNKYFMNYSMNNKQIILILFTVFKQLKFYKVTNRKTNLVLFKLYELSNENNYVEKILDITIMFFSVFFGFFTIISIHIFIANQNYKNWITLANIQDRSIFIIYLNSFYFIITTMTTVGYGDMLSNSFTETVFRIILLTVGISLYSWIVSNIGNYVNNESRISIRFNKDEGILEDIRIAYPNMPYKLYNKILHHLELRKIRQKKLDINLLINSLPYSLRNTILFAIHQQVIENFKIFKKCQNSDFINQLLTNFIPLFSKKNAILIYENQLIENIIFVKEGRLSIEAAIDIESPKKSINEYFNSKFIDINDNTSKSKIDSLTRLTSKSISPDDLDLNPNNNLKTSFYSDMDDSTMEKEIGRCEFEGGEFEESNYQFIKIVSIAKNESYGIVYMYLSKPSPLTLRVKSKRAELFLLRKFDAFSISKKFPNIWKRQYNKSYVNMNSIKNKTFKKLNNYCQTYGIAFEKKDTNRLHKNNYTIKEILEKAKQKDKINNIKSDYSISNIFRQSTNNLKKTLSILSPKNIMNNKRISIVQVPAKIKSFVNVDKKGTFDIPSSNNSQFKNNNMTFACDNSTKTNLLSSKTNRKSDISKGKKSDISKFKLNSSNQLISSNNDQTSSINIAKKESIKNKINNKNKDKAGHECNKNYINKLKKKIKKLKVSKLYYKSLLKKISDKLKEIKKQNNKNIPNEIITTLVNYKIEMGKNKNSDNEKDEHKNKNSDIHNPKVINNVIVQNNNNYICTFSDFISSDSNKSSSSTERKTDFSIDKINEFSYSAEYTNLKELTKGEIVKNSKFMKKSINYIKNLYNKIKNKKEKNRANQQREKKKKPNKSLTFKANKELLDFYSENISKQTLLFSDNEQTIKKMERKKQINGSVSSKKQGKIGINLNNSNNNKNNSKMTLLNVNNLGTYSFKMNLDNAFNQTFKKESNNKDTKQINNYQNENFMKKNSTFFSKKASLKKIFANDFEYESKSNKNISNENYIPSNNKEIEYISDNNSRLEQQKQNDKLSNQNSLKKNDNTQNTQNDKKNVFCNFI